MRSLFARITLGFLLLVAQARAEGPEYAMRDWHPADGLPSEDTTRVLQGRDGFLWVATTNGIARFDGAQFERVATRGVNGRPVTLARAMVEVAELGIVVAPTTGGLLAARGGGVFQAVPLPAALSGRAFNVLFAAADGALWGASDDGAVSRWISGARVAESFPTTDELNGRAVIFVASDARKRTWISNGTNLYRYAEGKLGRVETGRERVELRVGSSRRDGPWLVANERLLHGEGEAWVEKGTLPPLVSAHYIQTMLEDRDGALWIGTRSQGVFVFSDGVLTHVTATHDDILGLGEDAEGDVWVATNGGGLNRLRRKIFRLFDKDAGLIDNFSNTVCEDRDGAMWFGNRDGGVARLRPGGKMEIVPPPAAWPIISAVSVAPHPAGGIWVTAGPGIFRIADNAVPTMEQVAHPALPIIRCTLVAKSGALWFSAEPDRLGRLVDGTVTLFGREAGLGGKQVRAIAEDASGQIWCGMADGTLWRQRGERFERVALDRPAGVINAIHHGADGTVWLGTGERGLVVGAEGRWRSVDTTRGLPDNNVTQILADDRGNIWCGSSRGIFRVSRAELVGGLEGKAARVHAVLIGRDEGLKDISCIGYYQPAAWKSRDGKLWFTTRRGVLEFDPELAISEATVPPVRVEEITCDDAKLAARTGFALDAGFRKLELRFSVLCLATPERVRVRYRLDGFDGEWQSAAANHVAVYPRLPAGDYRFRVKASLADGEGEESFDEVVFSVVPPWWQTAWFGAGAAALAALGIGLVVRAWAHRRLRRKLEDLERQSAVERERTRIAQNIHDDLGASLTRISLLTQAAPPDAPGAAQLEKIYATAAEATRAMDEIVWAVNPKYDDLDGLAGYLGNFAQSFLGAAGIRCRLDMPGQWPTAALTSQMRHNLFLSCKEALHNVVKHAGASEVTLGVAVKEGALVVTIADNGCGRAGATGSRAPFRSAAGQGTENMRRRLAEMGGRCEIADAADGAGTTVTFIIPLAESV
jgi:signal transduction histidine kinase/streptogramin lyase